MEPEYYSLHSELDPDDSAHCEAAVRVIARDGSLWTLLCDGCEHETTIRVVSRDRAPVPERADW